jgi:hypothetical protein
VKIPFKLERYFCNCETKVPEIIYIVHKGKFYYPKKEKEGRKANKVSEI